MTTGKDDLDDAEFEAFLQGKGELAQKLRAMPQPAPSAELDAAILAQIELDLVRENALPKAANDPFIPKSWRAPLATAACAALVSVMVLWDDSMQAQRPDWRSERAALPSTAQPSAPAAAAPPGELAEVAKKAPATPLRKEKAELTREAMGDKAVLAQASTPAKSAETVALVSEVLADASPPAASAEAKRVSEPAIVGAAMPAAPEQAVTSARGRSNDALAAAPVALASRMPRAANVDLSMNRDSPAAWLRLIEHLLNAGASKNVLTEWDKFRAAHPDYPVPDALKKKIQAVKK